MVGPAGFEPAMELELARLKVWYPQPDWVTDPSFKVLKYMNDHEHHEKDLQQIFLNPSQSES